MIFDPVSATHLKPWLVRTLEPICDAEPGALADYILALLKHNVPEAEMRKELTGQLEEFLENECMPFIDTLFTVLRTKSYLPYSANPPSPPPGGSQDNAIPIPLDTLMTESGESLSERTRKRSLGDDGRDGRPTKGPRLSFEAEYSRYGNGRHDQHDPSSSGSWGGRQQFTAYGGGPMDGYGVPMGGMAMGMGIGMGMNGAGGVNGRRSQNYQPPGQKRGICRDYHNHGFCARGDMCKYSHGDDAVVPSQLYPMNAAPMMPFNYIYNMFNANAAYDPHEAQMDMRNGGRQNQRAPLLPRVQQEDGSRVIHPRNASGELPVIQDLTPTIPPDASSLQLEQTAGPQQQVSPTDPTPPIPAGDGYNNGMYPGPTIMPGMAPYQTLPMDTNAGPSVGNGPSAGARDNFRGRGGGHGGSRGRGTFGAEASSFRPGRRGDKTLVVEKIPEEKLSLEHVNVWFKKFGTVTNVAVDAVGAKALVSFSTHEEAHAAWKSEDAVFGNRFVKVFWHRPMEGHGQVGQRALAASATLVANLATKEPASAAASSISSPANPPIPASSSSSGTKKPPARSAIATALAAKQELLEKQISEQKALMESLSTANSEQKKEIMARLRKLGEEMSATSSATPTPTLPKKLPVDPEQQERERLDKELEMHGTPSEDAGAAETTEQLKAKLEKLKAEAASLGIPDSGAESSYGGGYRGGFRGRARGRGFYRGGPPMMRGGPPRGSMKLDNRPKKLLLKGVKEDEVQAVKDWYETTGQLESMEPLDNGDLLASFKSRSAAEQGLAKGTSIPTVGEVQISWYTGTTSNTPAPASTSQSAKAPSSSGPPDKDEPRRAPSPPASLHHTEEEEIIASGWDDDGMGML